jgi:hypothetical protein
MGTPDSSSFFTKLLRMKLLQVHAELERHLL